MGRERRGESTLCVYIHINEIRANNENQGDIFLCVSQSFCVKVCECEQVLL